MSSPVPDRQKWYRRRGVIAGLLAVTIPAIALGWWLFSPLILNKTVVEEFPRAAAAQIPAGSTAEEVEAEMLEAEGQNITTADDMPEESPTKLLTGEFVGADSFHQGSGNLGVYELTDGGRVLRFEDIDITNGPDLHVILSPVPKAEGREDVMASGYVDLGGLKGNRGSQNYDIPVDVDITSGEWTVVIYCQPFHVVFATASLAG
ncbi:MAG: hypothetical protein HKN91_03445 [Acidimicrobiia bacterium]|nr:hypothetical protein [Acidimicrobiia bacterium]